METVDRNKTVWRLTLLAIITIAFVSAEFENVDTKHEGIRFFEGTWKEAIEKSNVENKLIFLDVYATWCGPCEMLKRNTFSDKKVGLYFNTEYINVSLDGEDEEGRSLMRKYNLHAYPSLLVIGPDGKARVIATGYKSPKQLLEFGKLSLEKVN